MSSQINLPKRDILWYERWLSQRLTRHPVSAQCRKRRTPTSQPSRSKSYSNHSCNLAEILPTSGAAELMACEPCRYAGDDPARSVSCTTYSQRVCKEERGIVTGFRARLECRFSLRRIAQPRVRLQGQELDVENGTEEADVAWSTSLIGISRVIDQDSSSTEGSSGRPDLRVEHTYHVVSRFCLQR